MSIVNPYCWFKHSASSRNDDTLQGLIAAHGKQVYMHYFVLVELVAEQSKVGRATNGRLSASSRRIARELSVTTRALAGHLSAVHPLITHRYSADQLSVNLHVANFSELFMFAPLEESRKENIRKEERREDPDASHDFFYNLPAAQENQPDINTVGKEMLELYEPQFVLNELQESFEYCTQLFKSGKAEGFSLSRLVDKNLRIKFDKANERSFEKNGVAKYLTAKEFKELADLGVFGDVESTEEREE